MRFFFKFFHAVCNLFDATTMTYLSDSSLPSFCSFSNATFCCILNRVFHDTVIFRMVLKGRVPLRLSKLFSFSVQRHRIYSLFGFSL